MLWAIRRKADGAWFPIKAGSNANSWIEFQNIRTPARLPPRIFTSIGAARGTLTNWLKGQLVKDFDYEGEYLGLNYNHVPNRGTSKDYEVIPVIIVPIQDKLL